MPAAPLRPRRVRALVALSVAASVLMSGCSGEDDPAADDGSGAPKGAAEAPVLSPLTGRVLKDPPTHPVLAVKIDNSASSAPQVGVGSADMVVEELVEGGITRLAVFYYSDVPARVGPVRSLRATDIGIVSPLEAVVVASGGAPVTRRRIAAADIRTVTEGARGYYRESSRSAPYNLFMRLGEVARTSKAGEPPHPYLPFGDRPLPDGKPARRLTATFSPSRSTTFEFRDGRYVNTDSLAAEADRFTADTVLVLRVRVGDAGYKDPAGNPVPETKFTGEGPAMIFSGGRVVRGTWTKDGLDADVQLGARGDDLVLPPGKVWIELVPADGGKVSVNR